MAIVDIAFREWIADFKASNPGVADNRQIIDTAQYAFAAGRKAQREIDAAMLATHHQPAAAKTGHFTTNEMLDATVVLRKPAAAGGDV